MRFLNQILPSVLCLILLCSSLIVFMSSSFLGRLFAQSNNFQLGLIVLIFGTIASATCLFTIKKIIL